jgi:hypothetical protein
MYEIPDYEGFAWRSRGIEACLMPFLYECIGTLLEFISCHTHIERAGQMTRVGRSKGSVLPLQVNGISPGDVPGSKTNKE